MLVENWLSKFSIDTVQMTRNDYPDSNDENKWVQDVVNRALKNSFGSDEEISIPHELASTSGQMNKAEKDSGTYEKYPYPDEDFPDETIDGLESPDEDTPEKPIRKTIEWLAVIVGALLVAFLIKTFLMQAYYIPSSSMTPALQVGDRVLVNKLSYGFGDISRGDLIVFKRTEQNTGTKTDLIKRVIATEGEIIEIIEGKIYITENSDGVRKLLVEPYLGQDVYTQGFGFENLCPESRPDTCLVPDNSIFVMGDNRSGSRDSRYFGPVNESDVVGRAFIRIWPLGSLKLL